MAIAALWLLAFCSCTASLLSRYHQDAINVPVVFHVLDKDEAEDDIATMMEYCRKAFRGTNIYFEIVAVYEDVPMEDVPYETHSDNFVNLMVGEEGMVHIFVVHTATGRKNHSLAGLAVFRGCSNYILITDARRPYTIAHEVGHFYGLDHIPGEHNIMHSGDRQKPHFSKTQIATMRRQMKQYEASCR